MSERAAGIGIGIGIPMGTQDGMICGWLASE